MRVERGTDRSGETGLAGTLLEGTLRRSWWALALRGLLAIVIGMVTLTWPQLTVTLLLVLLGTYLIMDGILALVASFHASDQGRSWWPYLLEGLLSLVVGVLTFTRPATMALAVFLLVAFRSVITGFVSIGAAVWLRKETGRSEWLLWAAGLVSIAFGLFLVARPAAGVATLVWAVGIYAIVFGILEIVSAFFIRSAFGGGRHAQQPA